MKYTMPWIRARSRTEIGQPRVLLSKLRPTRGLAVVRVTVLADPRRGAAAEEAKITF